MTKAFWLDPVRRGALLQAMLQALTGQAEVAVEVRAEPLNRLALLSLPGARRGLRAPFSRHGAGTMVVLPLQSAEDATELARALMPALRQPVQVEAIQIARDGKVEFLAADEFHRECVSVGPAVPESLLEDLRRKRVIKAYCTPAEVRERFQLR